MVRGADQRSPSSTAKRSAWALSAAGSTHDRYARPSGPTVRFGSPLPGAAVSASSVTVNSVDDDDDPPLSPAAARSPQAASSPPRRTADSDRRRFVFMGGR